jgi:hypothetical protein
LWDVEVCDERERERERERAVVDVGVLHSLHTNAGAHLICVNLIFCNIHNPFCDVLTSSSCKPCLLRRTDDNILTPVKISLFISLCILRDLPPAERSVGSYAVGKIPPDFYILMFPWKDFLMGLIRKIQKHKEERDRSEKFRKTRRKEWRKEKEEIVYISGGSHTHVFSIGREHLLARSEQ